MIRVYFSFDYQRDLHRVKPFARLPGIISRAAGGFQSSAIWHEARRLGDAEVVGLIDDAMRNTTVSVICIGLRSAYSKYLQHEIEQSLALGSGLLGLKINRMRDQQGVVDPEPPVPPAIEAAGFRVYDYTDNRRLLAHIQEAVEIAERLATLDHSSERRTGDRRRSQRRKRDRRVGERRH